MYFSFKDQCVEVNVPDVETLIAKISERFRTGSGFALATVNLDHLVKMAGDAAFLSDYQQQDFVVADGRPIVWFSHLARLPVALAPGSDLVTPLCALAAQAGVRVAFVGSAEPVLALAATRLQGWVPGLQVVYRHAPRRNFDPTGAEAREILVRLQQEGIGLCFLALGAPKQERFAALGRRVAPGVGFASIGAGLDFVAGHQRRAPLWMRRLALEWLWRLLRNPIRLGPRYLRCFLACPRHLWHALRLRYRRARPLAKS